MYGNTAEIIPRNTFCYIGEHFLKLDLYCGKMCKARVIVVYLNTLFQ